MFLFSIAEIITLMKGFVLLIFFKYDSTEIDFSIYTQILVTAGLLQALIFFSSTRSIEKDLPNLNLNFKKNLFSSYVNLIFSNFIIISIILILFKEFFNNFFFNEELNNSFIILIIFINLNLALNLINRTWFRVIGDHNKTYNLRIFIFISNLASLLLIFYFNFSIFNSLLLIYVLESFLNLLFFLKNQFKINFFNIKKKIFLKRTIRYSLKSLPFAIFISILVTMDKVVIGKLVNFEYIGQYYFFISITSVFSLVFINIIGGFFLSETSKYLKINKLSSYINQTLNLLFIIYFVCHFFILFFLKDFLQFLNLINIETINMNLYLLFSLINLNQFLICILNIFIFLLFLKKHTNIFLITIINLIIYIMSLILLADYFNLIGAQLAISLSLILFIIVVFTKIYELFGISSRKVILNISIFILFNLIYIYFGNSNTIYDILIFCILIFSFLIYANKKLPTDKYNNEFINYFKNLK